MSSSDSSFSAAWVSTYSRRRTINGWPHTLLLGLLLGGLLGSTTGSTAGSGSTATTARRDGGELGGTLRDELLHVLVNVFASICCGQRAEFAYLVDVLAVKLGEELLKALVVSLNTDGLEDGLDVGGRGRGVATQAEEEVRSKVLHFG